jgi:hypothetical protein
VELVVSAALNSVVGAPLVQVAVSPAAAGINPPASIVPKGVTLPDGPVFVFADGAESVVDVYKTVFHELFHRGGKVRFTSNSDCITTKMLALISGPKPTPDQIQRLVDKLQEVAKESLPFHVRASPSQLPGLWEPVGTSPSDTLFGGKISLFTDNIRSFGDAYATLFHEILHLGLQRVISEEDYGSLLKKSAGGPLACKDALQWKQSPEGLQRAKTRRPKLGPWISWAIRWPAQHVKYLGRQSCTKFS